jgi:hypothetical protein
MPGGNFRVAWLIEAGGSSRKVNAVVGHAQLLKSVGSVLNPVPVVVPVSVGDGKEVGGTRGGRCLYYFQNDWEAEVPS